MAKAFLDKGMEKIVSRKLLVWVTCTAMAAGGFLTGEEWILISSIYIGGQSVIDGIAKLKGV